MIACQCQFNIIKTRVFNLFNVVSLLFIHFFLIRLILNFLVLKKNRKIFSVSFHFHHHIMIIIIVICGGEQHQKNEEGCGISLFTADTVEKVRLEIFKKIYQKFSRIMILQVYFLSNLLCRVECDCC